MGEKAERTGWVWRALAGRPADIAVQGVAEVPSRISPVTTRGMRGRQEEVVPHDPVGGAALGEPRGGLGPAPRGDGLPDLVQSGQPAEVDREDWVPGELPPVEERRGVSPELDPPAFGEPMEDQDQDEALEARIPDCNIALPEEWVQGQNPIQNRDGENDLP